MYCCKKQIFERSKRNTMKKYIFVVIDILYKENSTLKKKFSLNFN